MGLISVDIVLLVGGQNPSGYFTVRDAENNNKLAKLYRRHTTWVEQVWAQLTNPLDQLSYQIGLPC